MKDHNYYVYILTREKNSVFYVGVTNDLIRRVYEHKEGIIEGFTKKYNVKMLVYYEHAEDIHAAICREKVIKKWKRSFKMNAIERMNPEWHDVYFDLVAAAEITL
ncbi:MAG: GIY-YIG nuclease family protein [Gammaproteobacteria bacterium]